MNKLFCRRWFWGLNCGARLKADVRRNCRSYIYPVIVLWLVGLLAGFNFLDSYVRSGIAQRAFKLSGISLFNNTRQIDRTARNESTQQGFVFSGPALAMIRSKFVAVFEIAANGELAIDVVQFAPSPKQIRIKNIFHVLGLRRQSDIRFTFSDYFSVRRSVAMTVPKIRLISPRYSCSYVNLKMACSALTTIVEVQRYYGLAFDGQIQQFTDFPVAAPKGHVRTLSRVERFVSLFGGTLGSQPQLESDQSVEGSDDQRSNLKAFSEGVAATVLLLVGTILFEYGLRNVEADWMALSIMGFGFAACCYCFVLLFDALIILHLIP